MSMLLCPTCGKMSPLYRYDPDLFDDDIFIVKVQGLGRGRGFKSFGARSVFDLKDRIPVQEALEKLCNRVLQVIRIILDNEIISEEDLLGRLGISHDETSDLALDVLAFLDHIEELLYDADEETQKLATDLKREALAES
jgi:hypothetical protein